MSDDDLLSLATRALREETTGDDTGARFTRSRIMASVHEERVKRRTRWAFVIPIAATFVAASAFGAVTGTAHRAFEVVVQALGIHRSPPAPPPPGGRASSGPVARTAPGPKPAPAAPPAVETATPVGIDAPAPPPPVVAAPPAPIAAAPTAPKAQPSPVPGHEAAPVASAPDPTFELYKAAHQAHFVDRDWGRALGGWDAYLRAAPHGALAPEARYNRALCLLRLHRNDEARAALKPFAEGRYGTYRREDAQKLIEALPAGLDGP